ncbi:hypothetical protein ACO0LG_22550 [Undibacterium sp. Ji42W]|uniref:hypothetical protein n=1 Tax=Undibacterium sp. Ji42W TaxID=3413039 RepID=UPI003BF24B7E
MNRLLSLAFVLVLAGCASSGTQVSQEVALSFKEGVTTEKEIVASLGTPTGVMISGDLKIISYSGFQYKMKAASFIPIVGLAAGGADYAHTSVSYIIDKAGIMTKINYMSSGSGSRQGVTAAEMPSQEPKAIQAK